MKGEQMKLFAVSYSLYIEIRVNVLFSFKIFFVVIKGECYQSCFDVQISILLHYLKEKGFK